MKLKYIGNSFIPDIPARDLSDEEVERLGGAAALIATGLYAEDKEVKPAAGKKAGKEVNDERG